MALNPFTTVFVHLLVCVIHLLGAFFHTSIKDGKSENTSHFYLLYCCILQHPPDEMGKTSMRKLEYAGEMPRISPVEKNFLAQLVTSTSREVCFFF